MSFTVVWLPDALNKLAEVWTSSLNRNAVTAASQRIDRRLTTDPMNAGESRDADDRILIDQPLQVMYRVFPAAREVHVFACAACGRHS